MTAPVLGEDLVPVDSRWERPYLPAELGGTGEVPIIGVAHVDRVWMQGGVWWVDYRTVFPFTERPGWGAARMDAFVSQRTRVD